MVDITERAAQTEGAEAGAAPFSTVDPPDPGNKPAAPPKISTKAELDALPMGAGLRRPDGRQAQQALGGEGRQQLPGGAG